MEKSTVWTRQTLMRCGTAQRFLRRWETIEQYARLYISSPGTELNQGKKFAVGFVKTSPT